MRFTFTYHETAYTDGVRKDLERLETAGFTQVERRNTWASDQYKGINTQWLEPRSGVRFEVQFHTQASLEAKELTHQAYERIRTVTESTPTAERETAELRLFQQQANSVIPIPPGVSDIDDYPTRRTLMAEEITYYAIVDDLSSRGASGGVLRRIKHHGGETDETFGTDLRWATQRAAVLGGARRP